MRNSITLKFGRKNVKCRFGLGFIGEYIEKEKTTVDEVMRQLGENPFRIVPKLILGSAEYECLRAEKKFNLTYYQVIDLLDADGGIESDNFIAFIEKFAASLTKDVPKEDIKIPNQTDEKGEKTDEKKS